MNTSATGGYLTPAPPPAPLEDQSLNRFLQQIVVGVTGLSGPLVRPRWQDGAALGPPNIPPEATAWAAIGIVRRVPDVFAYVKHNCENDVHGLGHDELQRHEVMDVLCSFYDTGSGGQANFYADLLRDGLFIDQNRAVLLQNDMGLVEVTEAVTIPSLIKERWLYRIDETMVIRRQIKRNYPVLNITSAQIVLNTSIPSTRTIQVP